MGVPNTDTFTLQNVVDEINSVQGLGVNNLSDCFYAASIAETDGFDYTYAGNKDSLYNFRNYNASVIIDTKKLSLLAVWEMEDDANVQNDSSDINYALSETHSLGSTQTGVTSEPNGVIGKCIKFNPDNADSTLVGTTSIALSPMYNHSISIWFLKYNNNGTSSHFGVLYSKGVYELKLADNDIDPGFGKNTLRFTYIDSNNVTHNIDYTPPGDMWTSNWHHVVVTKDNDTIKLYVDAVLKTTVTTGTGIYYNSSSYQIMMGARYIGSFRDYIRAYVDQTAMWNRVLTSTEISELYNNGYGSAYSSW